MVDVDPRLRWAVEEVARLQEEARFGVAPREGGPIEFPPEQPGPRVVPAVPGGIPEEATAARSSARASQLTPKEIQSHLRAGMSLQDVARLAGTDVAWIERFIGPILAEREGIVEVVKASVISRPRLGRSGVPVGQAIVANLRERKLNVSPELLDDGWRAARRAGAWEVTFRYTVRGQIREAHFGLDADTRTAKALNQVASQIGWRPGVETGAPPGPEEMAEEEQTPDPDVAPRPAPEPTARATPAPTARATPTAKSQPAKGQPARGAAGGRLAAKPSPARGRQGVSRPGPLAAESPRPQGNRSERTIRTDGSARNQTTPPTEGPARRRSSFEPPDSDEGPEQERRAEPPARRGPSPRGAGPSDERRSFARSSSSPRPRRLLSETDGPEWNAAVARKRASRTGGAGARSERGSETPRQAQRPRPQKKRLPDDWLLEH